MNKKDKIEVRKVSLHFTLIKKNLIDFDFTNKSLFFHKRFTF